MRKILVDLDSMFDTRIGTMSRLGDGTGAIDLLENNYQVRLSDDFTRFTDKVTLADYRAGYAKRDADTLSVSRPTGIIPRLRKLVDTFHNDAIAGAPTAGRVHVDINIWPYKLTPAECDQIVAATACRLPVTCGIGIVSYPLHHLTTKNIMDYKYSVLYIYDYLTWYNSTIRDTQKCPHRVEDVTIICPQLAEDEASVEAAFRSTDPSVQVKDPFQALEMVILALVNVHLSFIAAEAFSLVT